MPTAPQHMQSGSPRRRDPQVRRLLTAYVAVTVLYLGLVVVLARLGVQAISTHVFPFYARYRPCYGSLIIPAGVLLAGGAALFAAWRGSSRRALVAFATAWCAVIMALALILLMQHADRFPIAKGLRIASLWYRWHIASSAVLVLWLVIVNRAMGRADGAELSARAVVMLLLCLVVFSAVFPAAIGGIRGGWAGISEAYTRTPVEYIGDIGKGGSIRGLFRDYVAMHDDLSVHSKVHPPGPVALLWFLSYAVGRGPLPLSVATIAFGALAVVPLYLWSRDLIGQRGGLTSAFLYALMPSIVLFTATSADILFTPFSITTLWLFDRALRRGTWGYAAAAGVGFGLLGLMSFNLLTLGAYFAFAGIVALRTPDGRGRVIRTALVMIAAFSLVHGAVYLWSGFDVFACFQACKAQFDLDQVHVTASEGRWPAWAWRFVNPTCWFYFAGIPISVLLVERLLRPRDDTRSLFLLMGATLLVLDLLYLARGEGERSAMYILPFMAVPAAHRLEELMRRDGTARPLVATLATLGFLCWLTELHLDAYW